MLPCFALTVARLQTISNLKCLFRIKAWHGCWGIQCFSFFLSIHQYALWKGSEWQMSGLGYLLKHRERKQTLRRAETRGPTSHHKLSATTICPLPSVLFPSPCLINISVRNSLLFFFFFKSLKSWYLSPLKWHKKLLSVCNGAARHTRICEVFLRLFAQTSMCAVLGIHITVHRLYECANTCETGI